MALTDAISVACKSLGFGADIYFGKDRTKYNTGNADDTDTPTDNTTGDNTVTAKVLSVKQINRLHAIRRSVNMDEDTLKKILTKYYNKDKSEELTRSEYDYICEHLQQMQKQQKTPA